MCLQVFLRDSPRTPEELETLRRGARQLGAAFQNVNFLRDLADDTDRLHRGYLGGTARLTDADRDDWVDTILRQLTDARAAIPLLPKDARAARAQRAGAVRRTDPPRCEDTGRGPVPTTGAGS